MWARKSEGKPLLSITVSSRSEWRQALVFFIGCWVLLYLLLKRRRAFRKSMIAMLLVSQVLQLFVAALDLATLPTEEAGETLAILAITLIISGLWIAYLWRSRHVREVLTC